MKLDLKAGWQILQDIHNTGECLDLPSSDDKITTVGAQLSEWEDLPELKHLQLLLAEQPYFGRELRYFNIAPWWYRNIFTLDKNLGNHAILHFTNADYYCKVWLNGQYLGEHEGYMNPFSFAVDGIVKEGENRLVVKVWSPWDDEVDANRQDQRTQLVLRHMVKGTYEHSDTFIQRDVNPVGLYGAVYLSLNSDAFIDGRPEVTYTIDSQYQNAKLQAEVVIKGTENHEHTLQMICMDKLTHEVVGKSQLSVYEDGKHIINVLAEDIRLWTTWDRGTPWLYDIKITLNAKNKEVSSYLEVTGFRTIELERDADKTTFLLNGKRLYIRGTSYFPDVYVSAMNKERYRRDLLNIKACGFNLVRVHVHVEQELFYEMCTEIGIAIIQDSEYNWMHPTEDTFTQRFISVFLNSVDVLKHHPAIFCWICMNEPTIDDPQNPLASRTMSVNPGPELYKTVREHDPSRPAIKGSFVEIDLNSGDSHNYMGSLYGDEGHYVDIFDTKEKFNTEYGFDAIPCEESLRKIPRIYQRYKNILNRIDEIQHYQYSLIKYYTEHYRIQKYAPNSGYVHFLFSDLGPNSYYGLFDWWGLPKAGLEAILESNMPIGVFLKHSRDKLTGVFVVNDDIEPIGKCTVQLIVTNTSGDILLKQSSEVDVNADSLVSVDSLKLEGINSQDEVNVALILSINGKVIAKNHYNNIFQMPEHVKGHPSRMSHETGIRLYFA